MRIHSGFSLPELGIALVLIGIMATAAVPSLRHGRHVLGVRAGRAELAALLATTRATAVHAGGASLVVDPASGSAWIERSDGLVIGPVQPIAQRHRVTLEADRVGPLRIRYDALGVGRMSNAVVRVRSGTVVGTITVSAYGRVRQ